MEITNLSPQPTNNLPKKAPLLSIYMILIVVALATALGFWLSRFQATEENNLFSSNKDIISIEEIDDADQIEVGKVYGNSGKIYKDTTTGIVQKGSINGVGTHILKREGGDSQNVSLTSSSVDLDLFIDRKVEIQGETNASDKTSWLLDVGMVTVLE
jgi:hypothetical protein